MKIIKRQGWIDRGVEDPESSADHSWAVALHAWLLSLGRDELDSGRVLLLALVHDLPEALAGDATPFDVHRDERGEIGADHFKRAPEYDPETSNRKARQERSALQTMIATLPTGQARQIADAWLEYSEGRTQEAQFVKHIDKLETLLQAELYRERQPGIVIDSFRAGTDRDMTDPMLREVLARILDSGSNKPGLEQQADEDQTGGRRQHSPEPDEIDC